MQLNTWIQGNMNCLLTLTHSTACIVTMSPLITTVSAMSGVIANGQAQSAFKVHMEQK